MLYTSLLELLEFIAELHDHGPVVQLSLQLVVVQELVHLVPVHAHEFVPAVDAQSATR